jgi:hypothetical protein
VKSERRVLGINENGAGASKFTSVGFGCSLRCWMVVGGAAMRGSHQSVAQLSYMGNMA